MPKMALEVRIVPQRVPRRDRRRDARAACAENPLMVRWSGCCARSSANVEPACRAQHTCRMPECVAALRPSCRPTVCRRGRPDDACESVCSPSGTGQGFARPKSDAEQHTLPYSTGSGNVRIRPTLPEPGEDLSDSNAYRTNGAMMSAKAVRARLRRDFTVPRFTPVISAISSYDLPSSSRSTNTSR